MRNIMEERIAGSETHSFKLVHPELTEDSEELFGGQAMQMMNEVAFITATRFARKKLVCDGGDQVRFMKAICPDKIMELTGKVIEVSLTDLKVKVEVISEDMYQSARERTASGVFTFVPKKEMA
jgi:acyl-CoA hydrolase